MASPRGRKGITRERILGLLRSGPKTVSELARELDYTDNAVRAHLELLESEDLVEKGEPQRGVRKPHQSYALTSRAEGELARGYLPALQGILSALEDSMSVSKRVDVLKQAGKGLGEKLRAEGSQEERASRAMQILSSLGGAPELRSESGECTIVGNGCPLSAAVACHPEVCFLAEALLEEVIGTKVTQSCEHGEHPRCCFRFRLHPAA